MKQTYAVVVNLLLFFFLVAVFSNTLLVRNNTVIDKVLVGIVFGIVMMLLPSILKFFKLPVNTGSLLLIGIIASFTFYFIGFYVLEFISITGGDVNLGISDLNLRFEDRTVALVVMSVTSALLSVFLDRMEKN